MAREGAGRVAARFALLLASTALLLGLSASVPGVGATTDESQAEIAGPFGTGAAAVWILRPRGPIRSVVVFGHGWKSAPPSRAQPWVGQFLPWLRHLVVGGNAVIFPRYQLGSGDPQSPMRVQDFRQGVQTGYVRLGSPRVPFVAAGYSFGASLTLAYAAHAARWHVPVPRALLSVFPAGMVEGDSLPPLASSTSVLILVGDEDKVAGRGGADQFWRWLARHPARNKHYVVVRSGGAFHATHSAPKGTTAAVRIAFWLPLDRLIRTARTATNHTGP